MSRKASSHSPASPHVKGSRGKQTPLKSSSTSSDSSTSSYASTTSWDSAYSSSSSSAYLVPPPRLCPACQTGVIRAVATVEKWVYPAQCTQCDLVYEKSGLRYKPQLPEVISAFESVQRQAWYYRQQLIAQSNISLPPTPIPGSHSP
ncbi:hypothetical protein GYMLUDRAFT_239102 [Collybiopsis luxurians FD-317 M1]|nr:hypothetical protein GYMLUDRAFT_239102 [Collybiopsis luxurians FD-317 M1]